MYVPGLKKAREEALLTQVELAQRVGVSEATINRLERGHNKARISTVRRLAGALGVNAGALIQRADNPAPAAPPSALAEDHGGK